MRLFEIAPGRIDGPENSLITILGHLKAKGISEIPLSKIVGLMQNIGHGLSLGDIKNMAVNNAAVQNLIQNISDDKVVFRSDNPSDINTDNMMPGDEQDVAMMAKRAASRRD